MIKLSQIRLLLSVVFSLSLSGCQTPSDSQPWQPLLESDSANAWRGYHRDALPPAFPALDHTP
jgi:hypothetical protein